MKDGGIILSAIVLLFVAMYVYCYSFEFFERLKESKKLKKQAKKEALRHERMASNAKVREEKSQKLNERSLEIKRELERLEKFRKDLLERQDEKKLA